MFSGLAKKKQKNGKPARMFSHKISLPQFSSLAEKHP